MKFQLKTPSSQTVHQGFPSVSGVLAFPQQKQESVKTKNKSIVNHVNAVNILHLAVYFNQLFGRKADSAKSSSLL